MRLKAMAVWGWTGLILVGWSIISAINPGELTTFGIPAALTLILGSHIWSRAEENRIGLLMLMAGSAWLLYDGCRLYASLSNETGPYAFEYVAAWLGTWTGPLFFVSFPTLLLLFPDGRATGFRRWVLLLPLAVLALVATGAWSIWGLPVEILINNDLVSAEAGYVWIDVAFVVALYSIIPATPSVIGRYRTGDLVSRQQIKWLAAGSIAFAIGLSADTFAFGGAGPAWWDIVIVAGMTSFPFAIGVAIFRYKLYDLGRLVSRTVTYAIVIALLGVSVAGAAAIAGAQFEEPWVVATTTLAVAALFNPLRRRVQAWIERRFNRSRYDAKRVMDRFAGSLQDLGDSDDLLDGWVGVVSETMAALIGRGLVAGPSRHCGSEQVIGLIRKGWWTAGWEWYLKPCSRHPLRSGCGSDARSSELVSSGCSRPRCRFRCHRAKFSDWRGTGFRNDFGTV